MIRVVIDTNPLVAAFINPRGYPARIISAWRNGEFQIIASPSILKEYERVFFFPEIRAISKWTETFFDKSHVRHYRTLEPRRQAD